MGPRPDGRGKFAAVVRRLYSVTRQWGRGQTAAESRWGATSGGRYPRVNGAAARRPRKAEGRKRLAARKRASMGPRPDGRGKNSFRELEIHDIGASMGPRPDGRGKRQHRPGGSRCRLRVNGAAARRPRKDCIADASASSAAGVNGAAARRPRKALVPPSPGTAAWRQWGRGQTAAERAARRRAARRRPASMGPRPDGRGKLAAIGAAPVLWLRQWGRGQTAAESLRQAADRPLPRVICSQRLRFIPVLRASRLAVPPAAPPPLLASRERPAPGAPCRARSRAHTTNDASLPPVGRAAPIVSMRPGPVPYDGPVSTTSMRSSP